MTNTLNSIQSDAYLKNIYNVDNVLYLKDKIINQQTKTISELMKTIQAQQSKNSMVEILTTVATVAGAGIALYSLFNKSK